MIATNCKTWNNAEPSRSTIMLEKSPVVYVALYVISQSPLFFIIGISANLMLSVR